MCMTKEEFFLYEEAVKDFFASEGITNLSSGHFECPNCGVEFDGKGNCPECGEDREGFDEPHFSWIRCDCCDRNEGGDRYFARGYNPKTKEIQEYDICSDCMYYAEYGVLDDMTMMNIESDDGGPRFNVAVKLLEGDIQVHECYLWDGRYVSIDQSWQIDEDDPMIRVVQPLKVDEFFDSDLDPNG